MTKLRDLFVYDLDRVIPPVAKVSDTDAVTVATELGEYVPTRSIEEGLARFLEVYADSRLAPTDRIGVWISGFFGSGKSHFAKILSYLLTNPTLSTDADIAEHIRGRSAQAVFLDRLGVSSRRAEIEALLHRIGMLDSQVIMLNIKAEQDQAQQDEGITQILHRVYLAHRGLSTDPSVARLELELIERDLYEAFKGEVLKQTGNPWEDERDDVFFVESAVVAALQAVAPESYTTREEARDAFRRLREVPTLTIKDLTRQLGAYVDQLAAQGDPERPPHLVFIVDEIGQFVGDDSQKLLELQSIAEEFGIGGKGKLWLIVTAQAKLDAVIAGVQRVRDSFGKIGDRFDTRLALTSDDVEQVLEERILKKKAERVAEIERYYQDHAGLLTGLAALPGISHDLPSMTNDGFVFNTPFLPYHPPLIQAIFEQVKSSTATGFQMTSEARSMIGMAQGVLQNKDNGFLNGQLGRLVSLDMVYDQIAVDLQTQDRREIDRLPDQLPAYRLLDGRVLKALYLLQAVPWIAITTDTLAHALIREVETAPSTLKSEVAASLTRLRDARYVVTREDDTWEFLTGAKKGFEEELAGTRVRQIDLRRAARTALSEMLRPIGSLNYRSGLRSFDVAVKGDEEEFKTGEGMFLEIYSPLHQELDPDFSMDDLEQIQSFSHPDTVYWIGAPEPELRSLLSRQISLDTVLRKWQDKAAKTDEDREIIREKSNELAALSNKIESTLRGSLINGTLIWNGRSEELDGRTTTLNPIFNRVMAEVVPQVYPRFEMAAVKPVDQNIEAALTVAPYALASVGAGLDLFDEDGHLNQHSAVVDEVRRELERRHNQGLDMTGKALEEHFAGGEYGWHPTNVRLIFAAMFRAGLISMRESGVRYTDYTALAAQAVFKTRPFRRALIIYDPDVPVEPGELRRAQSELRVLFDKLPKEETANVIAGQIREALSEWDSRTERLILQLRPAGYPVPEALTTAHELVGQVTRFGNPGQVVKAFLEHLGAIETWHQRADVLHRFVVLDKQLPIFERAKRLTALVDRAGEVPDAAQQLGEQAFEWRDSLIQMIEVGQVAEEWDAFQAIHTRLRAQFQRAYEALHAERAKALEAARSRLEAAGSSAAVLSPYGCPGLRWANDGLACGECRAALHELPTHLVAIPTVAQQQIVREQQTRLQAEERGGQKVVNLSLAQVLGGRRIGDETDRDGALDDLKQAIDDALQDGDVVTLV
jgi:hypothetical protein